LKKKIVFLTGTRADFGKLKSLIKETQNDNGFDVHIFATGMHMNSKYGKTVIEIFKSGFSNIYQFINHNDYDSMDTILAKTIEGLSNYIKEIKPDLLVIHGDRVETLAGAIVGSLNNILVAHIEGGEISGTIDELIRHAVSKMSHIHFVANETAKKRLIQMGEIPDNIFIIGSPDVDVMLSDKLPSIEEVKNRYDIPFDEYAVLMFHPVTTEFETMEGNANDLVDTLIETNLPFVTIYPNNDLGSHQILKAYRKFENNPLFKVYPSIRFEYFLVLLKHSKFIIGNSSAGIREAPYYGLPAINIGNRQKNRALHADIINCDYDKVEIKAAIGIALNAQFEKINLYGKGNSDKLFINELCKENLWKISKQKQFIDFK
jgi:UDP-N-acetylglucosamine 2-epimerase (hydrolysing)